MEIYNGGVVNFDGSIRIGEFFRVERKGVGQYLIAYLRPFQTTQPFVLLTAYDESEHGGQAKIINFDKSGFTVYGLKNGQNGEELSDCGFGFLVIA